MKEKLYLIKNDVNDLKYVGQTFRTLEARFKEHCYDDRSTSALHAAIKEIGPEHFTIELLEEVPSNQAYNRKRTYIEKYNTIRDGYNPHITLRNNNIHEQVMIEGTDIVFSDAKWMAKCIARVTSWTEANIYFLIKEALRTNTLFLGFPIINVSTRYTSPVDDYEEWIRKLKVMNCEETIMLKENQQTFVHSALLVNYIVKNDLSSRDIRDITADVNAKIDTGKALDTEIPLTAMRIPVASKQADIIYCPELQICAYSIKEMANKLISSGNAEGENETSAIVKIEGVLRGMFPTFRGFTLQVLDKN